MHIASHSAKSPHSINSGKRPINSIVYSHLVMMALMMYGGCVYSNVVIEDDSVNITITPVLYLPLAPPWQMSPVPIRCQSARTELQRLRPAIEYLALSVGHRARSIA